MNCYKNNCTNCNYWNDKCTYKQNDSPIKRVGGKRYLRKTIVDMIPEHTCYVEPFFGAGWVFFYKNPSKAEVINDIEDNIVNLFEIIQNQKDEFIKELKYTLHARQSFNKYKRMNKSELSDVEAAVRYWYLITHSFAAKCESYGYTTLKSIRSIDRAISRIEAAYERLKDVNIEHLDYADIIQRYDREHTFFYLDPPYFTKQGYSVPFEYAEHKTLSDMLQCIKGKFILSINDCDKARELYGVFNLTEVDVQWTINKGSNKQRELLVKNF